ncbi:MAG: alpha/beta fold hydrolase [Acidobacteriota bacterium]
MLEKLKKLQYGARIRLYSADQLQVIDVAGRRTQLLRGGKGAPLVYLHSVIGETNWLPFHQALSREFDVIAPAHPGFALSAGGEGIEEIEDVVLHYVDLFRSLGLERFHLVGASLGGWIAAEFALRYPERLHSLVLADAAGLQLEETPAAEIPTMSATGLRGLMLHDPASFVGELLFPETELPDQIRAVATGAFETTWSRALYGPRLSSRLHRITIPALVLWGANDAVYPVRYAEAFRDGIAGSKLHLIENCGHLPMFEQEARFVSAVTRFLKTEFGF